MINWLENHMFTCFFKTYFGVDCLGCGIQRSFIELLKGNFIESVKLYPALIPFLLTLTVLILQLIVKQANGAKIVMWLFILTSAISVINLILKLFSN